MYPAILAFAAALAIAMVVLLGNMLSENNAQESKQQIPIGLVGDISDTYLGIGVFAVQNFDTSKYYLDFIEMTEDEAIAKLDSGEIKAYIRIPDGFVESIVNGTNKKITYVMGNSPAVLGPSLMKEIATTVSQLVIESQGGIYSFMDFADTVEMDEGQYNALVEDINIQYIQTIFSRETAYEVHFVGVSNGLPFTEYYVGAFLMLLLMLCGTVCAHLLVKTDLSLPRLLYCRGHTCAGQIAAEYLPFAGMIWVTLLLLCGVVGGLSANAAQPLVGTIASVGDWLLLGVKLLPAALLITAMQFFFYELTSSIISGVLLQILMTISLAYASGFLYPLSVLPQTMQAIAVFLPTGVAFNYTAGLLTGNGGGVAVTVAYALGLLAAASVVRAIRLRGGADE